MDGYRALCAPQARAARPAAADPDPFAVWGTSLRPGYEAPAAGTVYRAPAAALPMLVDLWFLAAYLTFARLAAIAGGSLRPHRHKG